jgi:hypothetical protein
MSDLLDGTGGIRTPSGRAGLRPAGRGSEGEGERRKPPVTTVGPTTCRTALLVWARIVGVASDRPRIARLGWRSWDEEGSVGKAEVAALTGVSAGPSKRGGAYVPEQVNYRPAHWSRNVALDPRHRPQVPHRAASTVRREWWRWPQEAHLVEPSRARYRRLRSSEIARLQSFDPDWIAVPGVGELDQIRAIGDAVPPQLSRAICRQWRSGPRGVEAWD